MKIETVDLSQHVDSLHSRYKRLSKTQLRLLSSQVPESFVAKFEDEETALAELLDVIYGTEHDS